MTALTSGMIIARADHPGALLSANLRRDTEDTDLEE